jgi:hypothetical protein
LFIIADCAANNKQIAGKMAFHLRFTAGASKILQKRNIIFVSRVDFSGIVWYITFCTPKGDIAG